MREMQRIDRITKLLNKAWKLYPDFRFFQFLVSVDWDNYQGDLFYLEDDRIEKALKQFLEGENHEWYSAQKAQYA